ncbi:MAG: glutamate-5-semialdehyde dehydrogenase [Akkermansia sp.]
MSDNPLLEAGKAAKSAASILLGCSHDLRCQALLNMAHLLEQSPCELLEANALDVKEARTTGKSEAFLDRLLLTPERLAQTIAGIRQVIQLPDPVGACMEEWSRPNGIQIKQVRVPIGVIGFIYESRGTVTCDAASLCLKSGNAVILRGGKESRRTNEIMAQLIREGIENAGLPKNAVQLLSSGNREEVKWLCGLEGYVDVLIPRGGKGLVSTVVEYARMPVLKHLDGICHTFVDESADLEMAVRICDDAKTQRPGVCNAMETLLVHRSIAPSFLPILVAKMQQRHVELRGCVESMPWLGDDAHQATETDWRTEYEDLILSVKIVSDVHEAITHINRYGSHHSDAILTNDEANSRLFMTMVDSACVYKNCSTRFSDGQEFGFGAEIGIGTDKLHARGPMALRELTTYKYEIFGEGQVKDPNR